MLLGKVVINLKPDIIEALIAHPRPDMQQTSTTASSSQRTNAPKQIKPLPIDKINRDLIIKNVLKIALILFLVEDLLAVCISAIYIQFYEI